MTKAFRTAGSNFVLYYKIRSVISNLLDPINWIKDQSTLSERDYDSWDNKTNDEMRRIIIMTTYKPNQLTFYVVLLLNLNS